MPYRYLLFLALLLSSLLIASSDRNPICFVEYTDLRNTTFNGTAKALTESYSDGAKVVIEVEKIIFDPTKALRVRSNLIEGYLSSPICASSVLIGKQQMWTGSYKFDGIKLKFVVQVVRHSGTFLLLKCFIVKKTLICLLFEKFFLFKATIHFIIFHSSTKIR